MTCWMFSSGVPIAAREREMERAAGVRLRQTLDEFAEVPSNLRPPHRLGFTPFPLLDDPPRMRLPCEDSDDVRNGVVEFDADRQQPQSIVGIRNDAIAAEPPTEDLDLGFQEPGSRDRIIAQPCAPIL